MLGLVIAALVCQYVPADEAVTFDARISAWWGAQKRTRLRSMEQEAIAKGGTGEGSEFRYEDVGAGDTALASEIEAGVRFQGEHRVFLRFLSTRVEGRETLGETIEFDGDLHFPGERIRSAFSMRVLEAGYLWCATRSLFALPVRFDIGAGVTYYRWEAAIETDTPGPLPPTDARSNEVIEGLVAPVAHGLVSWMASDWLSVSLDFEWISVATLRGSVPRGQNENGMLRLLIGGQARFGAIDGSLEFGTMQLNAVSLEHRDEADVLSWRLTGLRFAVGIRF